MGGPNGGNGGKGSDIIFKADEGLKTLIDLRYMKNVKGKSGENGEGKNKNGKYAAVIAGARSLVRNFAAYRANLCLIAK